MNRIPLLLRSLFLGVPAVAVIFGITALVAGPMQAPRDKAAAQAFRDDPSCAADLAQAPAANGACSVVDAVVDMVYVGPTDTQALRTTSTQPAVRLRFPDGTVHNADLADSAGRAFVKAVYPGTTARVQLFRGKVVRVAEGDIAAETSSAPDVMASSDAMLPWAGAWMIAGGLVAGFFSIRFLRRLDGAKAGAHA